MSQRQLRALAKLCITAHLSTWKSFAEHVAHCQLVAQLRLCRAKAALVPTVALTRVVATVVVTAAV